MADFEFVTGNTLPAFAVQLTRVRDGTFFDLTGCTVALYLRERHARTAIVSGAACTITDAVNGKTEYRWASPDLVEGGTYDAEFRITTAAGKIQSCYIEGVLVRQKLG